MRVRVPRSRSDRDAKPVRSASHMKSRDDDGKLLENACPCCKPTSTRSAEDAISDGVETALLHGLFPDSVLRRTLLKQVGAAVLLGSLSAVLPIETLKAIAQEKKPLEKTK